MDKTELQLEFFEKEAARSLLDQLLEDSRLYKTSQDYFDLLKFTARLRNFAPFNSMLLHIQKPGLMYAASAHDWAERFGRTPKKDARPLLILWPFGPVALVYDVQDTNGQELPADALNTFFARGAITELRLTCFMNEMWKKRIQCNYFDGGDGKAGSIRVLEHATPPENKRIYGMQINRNHSIPTRFVTIAHELAHLFLGHLGADKTLKIPQRPRPEHAQEELEAESVAYLVSARNGIESKSHTYLSNFVKQNTSVDSLDPYQVMRAAGRIESLLGLSSHTRYKKVN